MNRPVIYILAAFAVLAIVCPTAHAQLPAAGAPQCRPLPAPRDNTVVKIDSVEWRDDLTRVYCRIIGTPHTSDRVDGVRMTVGKRVYEATDIDGVDFRRYFQWEDEGMIPLEIDFPAVKGGHKHISLVFKTIHGDIKAVL